MDLFRQHHSSNSLLERSTQSQNKAIVISHCYLTKEHRKPTLHIQHQPNFSGWAQRTFRKMGNFAFFTICVFTN